MEIQDTIIVISAGGSLHCHLPSRMLAARLTSVCRGSAGVLLRPTLAAAAPRPPLAQLARGYREGGRPFARRSRLREAQAQMAETAQTTKGKVGGKFYLSSMYHLWPVISGGNNVKNLEMARDVLKMLNKV